MLETFSKSVLYRILITVLLVNISVAAIVSGAQMYQQHQKDVADVEESLKLIEDGFLKSIASSAWNLNSKQLDDLVKGIQVFPTVYRLELHIEGTPELSHQLGGALEANDQLLTKKLDIIYPSAGTPVKLGSLTIYGDLKPAYEKTWRQLQQTLITNIAQIFLVTLLISILFSKILGRPIKSLSGLARKFEINDDAKPNIASHHLSRKDEVGILAQCIFDLQTKSIDYHTTNSNITEELRRYQQNLELMIEEKTNKLKETTEDLAEASRKAGMASIAIDLVHSLGNTLTSLRVGSQFLVPEFSVEIRNFSKVIKLVQDKEFESKLKQDGFKDILIDYIKGNSDSIQSKIQTMEDRSQSIHQLVESAITIINDQKKYTNYQAPIVQFELNNILSRCLQRVEGTCQRQDISIIRKLKGNIHVKSDPYKIAYIIDNILSNAIDAMTEMNSPKALTVSLADNIKPYFATLSIKDTGLGIDPTIRDQIFTYGFTTKEDRSGIGLHNATNWLISLQGSIEVEHLDDGTDIIIHIPTHTGK